MNIGLVCLTVGVSLTSGQVSPQSVDTLGLNAEIMRELIRYYSAWLNGMPGDPGSPEGSCSPDTGHECFGQDPDRRKCRPDHPCQEYSWLNEIIEDLKTGAREHPEAGWIAGYTIYTLMKYGRDLEAYEIAQGCQADEWYCSLLEGYVYQAVGRPEEADPRLRHSLELAPDSIACLLSDASWALDDQDRQRLQGLSCPQRLAASDTVWWLADPLYSLPGNARWAEHVSRLASTFLFYLPFENAKARMRANTPIQYSSAGVTGEILERVLRLRVPRGLVDSWEFHRAEWTGRLWTSRKAARYHFVPDFEGGDLSRPTWRLDGTMDQEGYTPSFGAFYELPVQIARFRRSDSMLVAVAGTLTGSPLADAANASAHLSLSDGPERFPVQLASALHDQRAVFLAQTLPECYVTSFEVLSEAGFGRHRVMLDPLDTQGPGVSDILLYRPVGDHEPDSLLIAAGMMLGETVVERRDRPGIYWETYGAAAEEPVSVELEVRWEGGGLLDRVTRLVPGGEGERGRLSWTEPPPGPGFRNAVVLDLAGLESGRYRLLLRTWWPGQEPLETERAFEVR